MRFFLRVLLTLVFVALFVSVIFWLLSLYPVPDREDIKYGVTFSKFRTDELELPWKETYDALVDDLGVRRFRFVAHWQNVEPEDGVFDFSRLDYQMERLAEVNGEAILAVGLRLPSWPECHVPDWAENMSQEKRDAEFFEYLEAVVDRYKDAPALRWWQVENEPFIIGFAFEQCGVTNHGLLDVEIGFVQSRDPNHPVLLTASGELGLWNGTWKRGDAFGTTLYRYVYNADLKSFITYPTTPSFFRAKRRLTELTTGEKKPAIIAELAAEPWPVKAIVDTPLEEQLEHMNLNRLDETLDFAARTSFDEQYLWGAEWWYHLKKVHGDDHIWERMRPLFEE